MTQPMDPITQLQNTTYTPKTTASADLSQVDFMKLIIAQMRNQNPLEPQSDTDFMAQMAQFEALNQMKTMAEGIKVLQGVNELTSAASMIGKTVTGKQVEGLSVVRDIVSRDLYGRPFAKLTSMERVEVNKEERVVAAAADLPNAGSEVTGRVDRVVTDAAGIPMLIINGKVVDLFTIAEVQS
jgi:flagellar basal-body rod modification protein FlgD